MSDNIVDGRRTRTQQSRKLIIAAVVQLVDEGTALPTAEQVSQVAGVTMRTVFRHFNDMESLYRELLLDLRKPVDALHVEYNPDNDWREEFDSLVVRRTGLFEKFTSRALAAQLLRHQSPVIEEDVQRFSKQMSQVLNNMLPASVVANNKTFSSIDALLSWDMWLRLRRDQNLSVTQAREVVTYTVDIMLKDAGV